MEILNNISKFDINDAFVLKGTKDAPIFHVNVIKYTTPEPTYKIKNKFGMEIELGEEALIELYNRVNNDIFTND